jgi:putative Holliday junction resolvase
MDGSLGFQAEKVQQLATRLGEALELPIEYVDERLTSIEAEEQLKSQKRFSSRNKGLIDQKAAAIILQQWLDELSSEH